MLDKEDRDQIKETLLSLSKIKRDNPNKWDQDKMIINIKSQRYKKAING